jgi:hypothetical protein
MKQGIVPADPNKPKLHKGDAFYHGGQKIGTVKAVLSSSYLVEFEPNVKVKEMSLEETQDAVDRGIL